jgi:hypothetical protein
LINSRGHELAVHSFLHQRPLTLSPEEFRLDSLKALESLKKITGNLSFGYRAPCFSLDRERLNILKEIGFSYDSSKISFSNHPLYGHIDISGFSSISPFVFKENDFFEFELNTFSFCGRKLPISGGAYFRIFPWFFTSYMLRRFLRKNRFYFFYIHPFELSKVRDISLPLGTSLLNKTRFFLGGKSVEKKIFKCIDLVRKEGFEIITFNELKKVLTIK